jgi:hypothetical protein
MKLSAEMLATELVAKNDKDDDDDEKETLLTLTCDGFDHSEVILEFEDGRKFKVDGSDLLECLSRISSESFTKEKED